MLKYSTAGTVLYSADNTIKDEDVVPVEDVLYEEYRSLLDKMSPSPVIVRMQPCPQGIGTARQPRYTQMRAILRASIHGEVRIGLSMIPSLESLVSAKIEMAQARANLLSEGIACGADIPIGIVVDTPSAALLAGVLAEECDFIIIDAQNLIRCSLAANYTDQQINDQDALCNPSILILIKCAIDGAHAGGLSCGIYGASTEEFNIIPALLGMGIDELFTCEEKISQASAIFSQESKTRYEQLANRLLMSDMRSAVREHLTCM